MLTSLDTCYSCISSPPFDGSGMQADQHSLAHGKEVLHLILWRVPPDDKNPDKCVSTPLLNIYFYKTFA